jgi:hypothetical protein
MKLFLYMKFEISLILGAYYQQDQCICMAWPDATVYACKQASLRYSITFVQIMNVRRQISCPEVLNDLLFVENYHVSTRATF